MPSGPRKATVTLDGANVAIESAYAFPDSMHSREVVSVVLQTAPRTTPTGSRPLSILFNIHPSDEGKGPTPCNDEVEVWSENGDKRGAHGVCSTTVKSGGSAGVVEAHFEAQPNNAASDEVTIAIDVALPLAVPDP